jgi:RNA polymerase sigma-70 factor (ECF subfamily)
MSDGVHIDGALQAEEGAWAGAEDRLSTPVRTQSAERLWSEQAPRLVRAAIALGVPPEEAADVVQDTLLAAFRALRSFDPQRGSFDAWSHAILVRRCSNWRRARARLVRVFTALAREGQGTVVPAPDAVLEARRTLQRLVGGLSPGQRKVWVLMEVSGLSARATAEALGLREATVRSHLRHARTAMRRNAEEAP